MNNQNNDFETLDTPEQNKDNQQIMGASVPNLKKNKQIKRSVKANQMVKSSQNKTKLVIILVGLVAVFFILSKVLGGFNINLTNIVGGGNGDNFKIDTGYDWADIYGTYIHKYYEELEISKMDISFVDFNGDNKPEMTLKYEDKQGNYVVKVYQINNKEVTETKGFYNSQFKLVYSSITGQINWYIYIQTTNKYGAYTLMSKILNGNAKDSDIKATNENELTEFNKTYLASDYRITYYEVKQSKFLNDFQTIVERYKEYNEEAKKERQKLEDATANWLKEQDNGNVKTSITVGNYTLTFGEYQAEVRIIELGVEKTIVKTIILRDGYLVVDGNEVRYTAYPSFITVADGTTFTVLDNNTFTYGKDDGNYRLVE